MQLNVIFLANDDFGAGERLESLGGFSFEQRLSCKMNARKIEILFLELPRSWVLSVLFFFFIFPAFSTHKQPEAFFRRFT